MAERAIDGGQLDGTIRDGHADSPASDESTAGTALGDPWQCSADCSSCCSLVASVATTVAPPRPANGARANVAEVVPRVPGDGSSEWRSRQDISRAATIGGVRAAVCNDCAGRGRAPTAGLQHAPSGSVVAVEWVTRGLRIEGLAAASASTFFFLEGACRCLIGCLHHRRAHGPLVPADHARRGAR